MSDAILAVGSVLLGFSISKDEATDRHLYADHYPLIFLV
jgi:hypothetical protein